MRTDSLARRAHGLFVGEYRHRRRLAAWLVCVSATICGTWSMAAGRHPLQSGAESAFLAQTAAAMAGMMDRMNVKASGDIDGDFAAMMIPHHQGAIEMAESELRYGSNEKLRRIAQEIVIDQQQEIVAMRLAIAAEASMPASPRPN